MLGKQTHRMQCGMMYNDLDPELIRARQKTMALTTAYAQSYSQIPAKREALLAKILGKIGKNVYFEPTFRCEFGKNISIGNNVLFGPRVGIYTADHAIDKTERNWEVVKLNRSRSAIMFGSAQQCISIRGSRSAIIL